MKRNEFLNYVRLVVVMVLLFSITLYSTDLRTYEIDDDAFDKYKTGNDNYSSWMIPENIPRFDLYEYKHVNPIYNKQLEERGGRIYFSFLMTYASCRPADNEKGYTLNIYDYDYLPKVTVWPRPLSEVDKDANWLNKLLDVQTQPLLEKRVTESRLNGFFHIELVFDATTLFKLSKEDQKEVLRRDFDYYYLVDQGIEFTWFLAFKRNLFGQIEVSFISNVDDGSEF